MFGIGVTDPSAVLRNSGYVRAGLVVTGWPEADPGSTSRCRMPSLRLGLVLFVVAGCNHDRSLPAASGDLSMAGTPDQALPAVADLLELPDEAQAQPDLAMCLVYTIAPVRA